MIKSIHPYLKAAAGILAVAAIGVYVYTNTQTLIAGPRISITSPADGALIATSSAVSVTGSVKHATHVNLNGRAITIDQHGRFREQLLLMPGYNIISIYATDRFGRTHTRELELVFRNPSQRHGSQKEPERTEQERQANQQLLQQESVQAEERGGSTADGR